MVTAPNFFIIGAPKCGTTSLHAWLSTHPNIFMPGWKEPHYFNDDHRNRRFNCEREYLGLFRNRKSVHAAVGEASVWYLYSKNAVKNILSYNKDARFIVCLRNPIDMAQSLHNHLLFSGYETIRDFERAWEAQTDRARGRRIPLLCQEPAFLQYREVCSLGSQLRRLYKIASRKVVVTVMLDDVVRNPRSEYLRVLEFLGLPDDGRNAFPVANTAMQRRSYALLHAVQATRAVKDGLGIAVGSRFLNRIDQTNRMAVQHQEITAEAAKRFTRHFAADITLLADLLSRDLSHWLKCEKKLRE